MEGIKAELVGFTPDYMKILQLSAGKCYGNEVSYKGVQSIINSGHLSVLEHCNAIFDVNCSIAVLGQLTRHRHLSFTVKSARGSEFEKFINPYYFDDLEKEIWLEKIDIHNFEGGFTPLEVGGNQQTLSIKLKSSKNQTFTARSVDKDQSKVLPKPLKNSFLAEQVFSCLNR